jgi:drug/metabolite transporter (DMT)-like permease
MQVKIGYASAITAAVLFGSVSTVAKPPLETIHPIVLASFVYLLASLVATPLIHKGKSSMSRGDKGLILTIAFSGAVAGPVMFFTGLEVSTAADSSLLVNGEIIFSAFFAILIFREKLSSMGYLSVLLVIVGVVIVTTNMDLSASAFNVRNTGNLLIIGATLFWALDNNLTRILSNRIDVARIVQLKSLIGGSFLLLLIFVLQVPLELRSEHIPNIILLGTAGFGASIFLFIHALKRIGTVKTVMIFSTSAIFGLFFAALFLQEQISTYQMIAIGVIISGFYLLYKKEARK